MIYIAFSLLTGLWLGYLGYRYQTVMYDLAMLVLPAIGLIMMRIVPPFYGVLSAVPSSTVTEEAGRLNGLEAIIYKIANVPDAVISAILWFPLFFILGRLATWAWVTAYDPPAEIEDRAGRKSRLFKEMGYEDEF